MKWKDLSDKTQKEKQMGFLKKLFGNVEKANKGEIPVEEIVPPFTIDLAEEADDYWRQMEENLLINAVKALVVLRPWNELLFLLISKKIKKPLSSFIR